MKNKVIYHWTDCDYKIGEVEGMFDEKFKLISCWNMNDANWRDEYFSQFMEYLGVKILNLPNNKTQHALEQVAKDMGIDLNEIED